MGSAHPTVGENGTGGFKAGIALAGDPSHRETSASLLATFTGIPLS
jgi:hypothetical protein